MALKFIKKFNLLLLTLAMVVTTVMASSNTLTYEVLGVDNHQAKNNIAQRLNIMKNSYGNIPSTDDIQAFYEEAPSNIEQALQPFGYFKPTIHHKLQHHNSNWLAQFHIQQGPPLIITTLDIQITGQGYNNAELLEKLKALPLKQGQRFSSQNYANAQTMLFNAAQNLGYLDARFTTHEIKINLAQYRATVILHFDTGNRYYFGDVTFNESPYSQKLLHRFVNFKAGDPYDPQKIQTLQTDLSNSKYFSSVIINPKIDNAKHQYVPIKIDTTPAKSQQYNFGLGFGTNTGFRTSIGANFNRLTASGQHLSLLTNLSQVNTGLSAKYYFPGSEPARNQYFIGSTIQTFDQHSGDSEAFSIAGSGGYETTINQIYHSSLSMNVLHERFEIDDDPTQTVNVFYPSWTMTRLSLDDSLSPTRGTSISLMTRGGGSSSSMTFAQAELTAKWLYPVTRNAFVILRGQVGTTTTNNYDKFPLTLRYFAGGINSVRGYGYQDLGPGKYLRVGSVELQHRLRGNLYGAIFYDIGNATDEWDDALEQSAGVGLVYRSPIGPIEAYLARPLEDTNAIRFEFSIGAGL
ncbi:MAG: autotransporter assembly complex protein TamA [Gammaproteobacteria bacterium]